MKKKITNVPRTSTMSGVKTQPLGIYYKVPFPSETGHLYISKKYFGYHVMVPLRHHGRKQKNLGTYKTLDEALETRDKWITEMV